MSTILCDGKDVDEIINEFGTSITLINVTTTHETDEYHEPIESENNIYNVVGMVENMTSSEDRVKEGLLRTGDIYIYLKLDDQQYAVIGNYIVYAGNKYQIKLVDKEQRGDIVYVTGLGASIYEKNVS